MIHTALITSRVSRNVYDKFRALDDTIYISDKNQYFNSRYRENGINLIGYYIFKPKFQIYIMAIKINFKKLINENYDKTDLLKQQDIENKDIELAFNKIIQELNIGLPLYENWKVNRIDYCVNIKTPYVKEYINILNKSDMPSNLTYPSGESGNYSKSKDSFYLVKKQNHKKKFTQNVRINFYNKQEQLKNAQKQGKQITAEQIVAAKNILRLEVQCFKSKTEYLKSKYSMTTKNIYHFLNAEISHDVILNALSKIVRVGDYRRKSKAIELIDKRNGHSSTNNILKQIVNDVAVQHNAVYKVREKYIEEGMKKETFRSYLKDLDKINVNPVTIPDNLKLEGKRYDEGLTDLITLFEKAFSESYYDRKIEVDIVEDEVK